MLAPGCSREPYAQSTPDETILAAKTMIEKGEASKLPRLIYSENEDMRRWLSSVGRLTGDMQELARTLQEKFPDEVASLRARAAQAAQEGKATTLFGQLAQQTRRQGRNQRRQGPPKGDERTQFDDAIVRLLADPYAFLRESEGRLTTAQVDDERVAVLWDGKPVLQPLGMLMQRDEQDRWCFVLPTNIPGAQGVMPQSKEQWEILGMLVTTLDKVVKDLTVEVQDGRLASLDAVSRRAGEMTFVPAVMVFYAYGKYTQEMKEQQKAGG
jgi:hypothetical protein